VRVVIGDDSRIARMFLKSALRGSQYQIVAEASTGVEIVTQCRRFRPDLALVDNSMPGALTGSQAAHQVRELDLARYAIVLSSLDMDAITGGHKSNEWRAKKIAFIGKTNDSTQLQGMIAQRIAELDSV
jgi:DNA-binding NarL/FixJ family response regulator